MNESACLLSTLEKQKMKKMKTFCVCSICFSSLRQKLYIYICVSLSHERVDVCKTLPPQSRQYLEDEFQRRTRERIKKKRENHNPFKHARNLLSVFLHPLRIFVWKCENSTYHWACWRYFKIHVHSNRLTHNVLLV